MSDDHDFENVWRKIEALQGTTIRLSRRGTNDIILVDARGVTRRTSTGHVARMSINSVRWTVDALRTGKPISRAWIFEGIGRRESSGVVAVLVATGLYELTTDLKLTLRRRDNARTG